MKKSIVGAAIAGLILLTGLAGSASASQEKVTLCHAAGLDGTTHYVTLTVGYNAAYGPAGHFYENGTPRAGHEQDYLGPCVVAIPSPSPTLEPSSEPSPTATPTPEPSSSPQPSDSATPPAPQDSPTPSTTSSTPRPSVTMPPTDTVARPPVYEAPDTSNDMYSQATFLLLLSIAISSMMTALRLNRK